MSRPHFASVLLLAAFTGCSTATADEKPVPAPVVSAGPELRVEVVTLAASEANLRLSLPGEVKGKRDANLAAPLGGYVEVVHVEDGSSVRKGQPIVRVNSAVYAAQRDQAHAQLALAEAALERTRGLGDLASAADLQTADTQAEIARANARLADINAARSVIAAPFDGVIAELGVEVGEVAQPGAPVARLVSLDPIRVAVTASDRDVVGLRPEMPVRVLVDATAASHEGRIATISPAADVATRAFTVEVEVPNPDRALRPGMIATVSVSEKLAEGAIVIPQDWVVTSLDGLGVFVEQDGVARWRPVRTGQLVHDQVVVTEGLSAGDRVVVTGHRALQEGDRLLIAREGTCCTNGRAEF